VHDHRLWELYLIQYADVAPSQVDRDADAIEHVLDPDMVAELEALVREQAPAQTVPPSPHPMEVTGSAPASSS
jgi:Mn-dependent DtxR family transcriptional regulator